MEACAKLLIHRVYQVANYIVLFTKDVVLFPSNYKNAYSPEGAITPFCTFFDSQDILSPTIVIYLPELSISKNIFLSSSSCFY